MITLLYITDLHLSDIPPGRRADNYKASIFDKLKYVRNRAHELNADVLCGGDWFHYKNPKAVGNPLSLIEESIREARAFPNGRIIGNVGNHDIQFDRMDTLSGQPLGLMMAAGVYDNVVTKPLTLKKGDVVVVIKSFPYTDNNEQLLEWVKAYRRTATLSQLDQESQVYSVGVLHAYGHPEPKYAALGMSGISYDPIGYDALAGTDFDVILWGHDHRPRRSVQVGGIWHVAPGSLARAAFENDLRDRPIRMANLQFSKNSLTVAEESIPAKPFSAVFQAADKDAIAVAATAADQNSRGVPDMDSYLAEVDSSVGTVDASDSAAVLKSLADDGRVLDAALEVCGLR